MATMPTKCPACGAGTHVKLLKCPSCETEVQGNFPLSRFSTLEAGEMAFLETFLRFRGNLKDVGAELGISYPTARNRLDALLIALGYAEGMDTRANRIEILNRLKNGEITVSDAEKMITGALHGCAPDTPIDNEKTQLLRALRIFYETQHIYSSALQRKLRLDYANAESIMSQFEQLGIISEGRDNQRRQFLVTYDEALELLGE